MFNTSCPDNIRSMCNVLCNASNGLNVCHLNVGSIRSKYTVLLQMLNSSKLDIIMISESWLSEGITSQLVCFNGFKIFRNDRCSRGGGVCIYVREHIPTKVIYSSTKLLEFLCVEINNGVEKCLLVVVYCPPCLFKEENLNEIEETLFRLNSKYSDVLIAGDFNVNLLVNNRTTRLFKYFCEKLSLSVVNTSWPTCFQSIDNPSLIDMFLTTSQEKILCNEQIKLTSEFIHDLIFCSFQFNVRNLCYSNTFSYRSYRSFNYYDMQHSISNNYWDNILYTIDVNSKVLIFNDLLERLFNAYVPLVTKRVKNRKGCPWYRQDIEVQIKERERFFKRYKRNPTDFNRNQYIFSRNKVTALIRSCKKNIFYE